MATKSPTAGRLFDARPDRLDLRDLVYRPPLRSLPPVYPAEADVKRFIPSYVAAKLVLDQGDQGACTGFGLACVANYLLWTRHLERKEKGRFVSVSPRMFYELAKRYDEWPGVDYEGSSCRGALKGWHKHGVCSSDDWPYTLNKKGQSVFTRPSDGWERDAATRPLGVYYRVDRASVVDLQAAIVNIGAVYVSATAHDGWDTLERGRASKPPERHASLPVIPPCTDPKTKGGHAFALVGYNERGFIVQNSWGTKWGASGFGVLPYDDWVVNATDAWACALGVPVSILDVVNGRQQPLVSTRWRVGSGQALTKLDRSTREPNNPPNDPWPFDHPFSYQPYEPWSTAAAYEHTLVTGNNGEVSATDFTRDAMDKEGIAKEIVWTNPKAWFANQKGKVLRIAVYAHGGLNKQDDSIQRIRVMGPCFEANGAYPIFLTWKTGAGESIEDMVQDWVGKLIGAEAARSAGILEALGDAKDRAVEATGHVLGKGLWSEMRENAAGGAQPGHGLALLAQNLIALKADLKKEGKDLEVHLVGHSAGAILLGHFLTLLDPKGNGEPPLQIATTSLYAAACSVAFANRIYLPAAQQKVIDLNKLWLYVLTDDNERKDGLPTPTLRAYGKSLLYLVSRALDDVRKIPLLGMERSLLAAYAKDDDQWDGGQLPEMVAWQKAWPGSNPKSDLFKRTETPQVPDTKRPDSIQATHGSFDNNITVLTETIARVSGRDGAGLVSPLEWMDY
jgi:hypothetical protein